jgi:hypothetical protein
MAATAQATEVESATIAITAAIIDVNSLWVRE